MVHALEEIGRVLRPGGALLDLRPIHTVRPLEIVTGQQVIALDTIDYSDQLPNDQAADTALRQMVQAGWYSCQQQTTFEHNWYWDTVPEMVDYCEQRDPPITFSEAQVAHFQQQLALSGAGARLRMPVNMLIALYRKVS